MQSMCTTDTMDTEGSVCQAIRIADAGGEMVRYTAQGRREAENLKNIRQALRDAGYDVPLVADIHFDYRLAIAAMENGADKIRINPGNIGSRDRVQAVADVAKERRVPIRVGVERGSLEKEAGEK